MSKHAIFQKFAERYGINPDSVLTILKNTAFKVKNAEVTEAQMVALLVVADQYGLNPFTKEIFAYPDKNNGIVPVVSVDGWSRIINEHPQNNGFQFAEADKRVKIDDDAQECPEWQSVTFYRKDREHATTVKEYIDEVYRPRGKYQDGNLMPKSAWQTHTKRFHRHKTFIQGARLTFGFAGIYDDDEARRIIDAEITQEIVQGEIGAQKECVMPKAITNNPGVTFPTVKVADVVDAEIVNKGTGEITQPQAVQKAAEPEKAPEQKAEARRSEDIPLPKSVQPPKTVTVDHETGEVLEQKPAPVKSGGALLTAGGRKVISEKLKKAQLGEDWLVEKHGKKLDQLTQADLNPVALSLDAILKAA